MKTKTLAPWKQRKIELLKQQQEQFNTDDKLVHYIKNNVHLRGLKNNSPMVIALLDYVKRKKLFDIHTAVQTYMFYIRNDINTIPVCEVCNKKIVNLAFGVNRTQRFCSKPCQGKSQYTGNWPEKIDVTTYQDNQVVNEIKTRPTCKNITKNPNWVKRLDRYIEDNTKIDPNTITNQDKIHVIKRDLKDVPGCLNCGTPIKISPLHSTWDYKYQKLCSECHKKTSSFEIFIQKFLDQNNVKYDKNTRSILNNKKELDIYIPDKNLAIEINGLYWHSTAQNTYNKLQDCINQNIRLIQIFTDEIDQKPNIVRYRLRNMLGLVKYKIGARECKAHLIDKQLTNKFLNKYHIQSADKSQICLGLFYHNHLVSVMTFSKPRIVTGHKDRNDNQWELSRFVSINSFHIQGAAGKLLNHFIENYKPRLVYSYCDLRWGTGNVYKTIGFKYVKTTKPNYWYCLAPNYKKREHRFNFRKSVLHARLKQFDPNISERQNMANNGHFQIFDSGSIKFEYQIS